MSTTPRPQIHEAVKGADKILHPSAFRITSLDLGLKWRATTGSAGLWAAARACIEIPSRDHDTLTPAEDALMVMLLGGQIPVGAIIWANCRCTGLNRQEVLKY